MDDLRIFAKSECEINGLVSTVQILSNDIEMEFGIKKCGVLVSKRGTVVSSEGVEMPDGKELRKLRKMDIGIQVFQNTTKSRKAR